MALDDWNADAAFVRSSASMLDPAQLSHLCLSRLVHPVPVDFLFLSSLEIHPAIPFIFDLDLCSFMM